MQSILNIFIGGLVLTSTEILYGKIALNSKFPKLTKMLPAILIVSALYTIVYFNLEGISKTAINFLIHIIYFKYLFEINASKSILLTFVYSIILIIPDLVTLFVAIDIAGINKTYFYSGFVGTAPANIIVCFGFMLLTIIIQKYLHKLFSYKLESNILNIIYLIGTFTCVVVVFYKIIEEFQEITHSDTLILVAMIIVFVTILMSYYKARISKQKIVAKYDKMLEFIKVYETEIETQRVNNHEIKNQFTTIKSMMLDGVSSEGIVAYIDEIYGDIRKINN